MVLVVMGTSQLEPLEKASVLVDVM